MQARRVDARRAVILSPESETAGKVAKAGAMAKAGEVGAAAEAGRACVRWHQRKSGCNCIPLLGGVSVTRPVRHDDPARC